MSDHIDDSPPRPEPTAPQRSSTGSVWGCVSLMLLAVVAIGALVWFIRPASSNSRGPGGWNGGGGPGASGGAASGGQASGRPGAAGGAGTSGAAAGTGGGAAQGSSGSGGDGGGSGGKGGRFRSNGPMPVVAVAARLGDTDISLNALGTVTSLATVTVRAQIPGQLNEIAFKEGQIVQQGDYLAQIDPRPYQIALEQNQGQLQRDVALLKEAEIDLTRYQTLVAQDSIAKQQLDTQESLMQQYRGTVVSDQAMINTAKLNLAYCHIIAPVTGRVGIRQVDQGNYVQVTDTNGIVVITQLQPISVIFSVPEDHLPSVLKRLHAGATLATTAFDRAQTTKLATGVLVTVDNQIDTTTGTVKMRAQFDNKEETLFPNQFVNIQLLVDVLRATPVIPVSAVQRGAPGTYVYVVNDDKTVSVRPITIGPGTADSQSVLSGLAEGDLVVIDGADKLKEGAQVVVSSPEERGAAAASTAGADGDQKKHRHRRPPGDPAAAGAGDAKDDGSPAGGDKPASGAAGQDPAVGGPKDGAGAPGARNHGGHKPPADGTGHAPADGKDVKDGTDSKDSKATKDEKAP